MMTNNALSELRDQLRAFAVEREWDKFHNPKNLAMALAGEAGELVAEFQWLSEEEAQGLSSEQLARVKAEASDVLLYLIRLADKLNFDLLDAAAEKLAQNRMKYPADLVRGSARKYSEY
ncbi:MAG: nucleotide pyrophosphohydrolase [Holophagaceae bacterium]|nr:nucleotide pyrophosphohydrolase [Holophagaceae bacterium]